MIVLLFQVYDAETMNEALQENLKLHLQKRITSHATISEERKQKKFRSSTVRPAEKMESLHVTDCIVVLESVTTNKKAKGIFKSIHFWIWEYVRLIAFLWSTFSPNGAAICSKHNLSQGSADVHSSWTPS